jgi:PAS domain-containing protein
VFSGGKIVEQKCGWCGKGLGNRGNEVLKNEIITHGICAICVAKFFEPKGISLRDFLDRLTMPIVAVDGEGTVFTANQAARSLLGKELDYVEGLKGGEVFECAYAKMKGGCGRTIHCSGCTIRRAITATYETGGSNLNIPATLRQGDPAHPQKIGLTISSERVNGVVLLRVDAYDGRDTQKI